MNYKAYWIHICGEIVPVQTTHIAEVIKAPTHFGYTRERIDAEYSVFHEPIGHEGNARQSIMLDLIKNHGWIRVRYTPRYDSWVVELNVLSDTVRLLLVCFFSNPNIVNTSQYSTIRVTEFSSADSGVLHHNTSIREICKWVFGEAETDEIRQNRTLPIV